MANVYSIKYGSCKVSVKFYGYRVFFFFGGGGGLFAKPPWGSISVGHFIRSKNPGIVEKNARSLAIRQVLNSPFANFYFCVRIGGKASRDKRFYNPKPNTVNSL